MIRKILPADDAQDVVELYIANRAHLERHEAPRDDLFFTLTVQRERLKLRARSGVHQFFILDQDKPAGLISLFNVLPYGPESCSLGYWVAEEAQGRGLATAAVGEAVAYAFDELGLHRVEASTLLDNAASQAVLRKNFFCRYGEATRYLRLGGAWHDMALYERVCGVTLVDLGPLRAEL